MSFLRSFEDRIALLVEELRLFAPSGRERTPAFVAWALGLAAFAAIAYRFHFNTDITDETFSIALPYRFVLGDKPFVDEITIQQTPGFILYPFVWLYVHLARGTTGLVLFVRYLHLLIKVVPAVAAYLATRHWVRSRALAVVVAFVPFVFVPHSIPNVGYNVIAMTMLAAGTFFGAAALSEERPKRRQRLWFAAGFCLATMTLAYPPLALAALSFGFLVPLCATGDRLRATLFVAAGAAALCVLVLPAFLPGGVAGVRRSLAWGAGGESHGWALVEQRLSQFRTNIPTSSRYVAVLSVIAFFARRPSLRALVALALVPTLALAYRDDGGYLGTYRLVTYLGALAPFALLLARPDLALVRASILVLGPTFAAAVLHAVFSSQQLNSAAHPFFTGVVLVTALSARAIERSSAGAGLALVPAACVLAFFVIRAFDTVYRDVPFMEAKELVTVGPFKGIRTSADRVEMFRELHDITRRFDQKGGRFTLLYEAPGLYLFSRMPPGAHSVWEEHYGDMDGMAKYWLAHRSGRGIVVRRRGWPGSAIDPLLAPPERQIYETKHFIVYREE
jgi:hypothetical protein